MTTENTPPGEKLTVKVSSIIEQVITIDQFSPEWSWLQQHPRETWQQHLDDSANTTDGQLEAAIEDEPIDVVYRDVKIIGPHTFLRPQPDPWVQSDRHLLKVEESSRRSTVRPGTGAPR